MDNDYEHLLKALSDMRLSEEEAARIRSRLHTYISEHPARVPFRLRLADHLSSGFAAFANPRLQLALASLALVFVAGGGTAYAAGNALPGDPLYAMKVNIEEPLQGAFATSAQEQANWNAQLAARRLSEAEELAAQNKLTPSAASTVAQGLDQATEGFDASVSQLATSSNNVATVASLESNMAVTLAANTQVLGEIATAVPSDASSIAPLMSRVQSREVELNNARTQLDTVAAQADASGAKVQAQEQLDAVQGELSDIQINAVSQPQALAAEASIQAGQQNLQAGNYAQALETIQTATLDAQVAQLNANIAGVLHTTSPLVSSSTYATSSDAFTAPATTTQSTDTTSTSTTTSTTTSGDRYKDGASLNVQ